MSAAHTPGPWEVCVEAPNVTWGVGRTVYSASENSRVADVTLLRNDPQAFADARLIAAAPDLLEALIKARAQLQLLMPHMQSDESGQGPDCTGYFQALVDCSAAIAKAKGAA